jgi:hypothetical protein
MVRAVRRDRAPSAACRGRCERRHWLRRFSPVPREEGVRHQRRDDHLLSAESTGRGIGSAYTRRRRALRTRIAWLSPDHAPNAGRPTRAFRLVQAGLHDRPQVDQYWMSAVRTADGVVGATARSLGVSSAR